MARAPPFAEHLDSCSCFFSSSASLTSLCCHIKKFKCRFSSSWHMQCDRWHLIIMEKLGHSLTNQQSHYLLRLGSLGENVQQVSWGDEVEARKSDPLGFQVLSQGLFTKGKSARMKTRLKFAPCLLHWHFSRTNLQLAWLHSTRKLTVSQLSPCFDILLQTEHSPAREWEVHTHTYKHTHITSYARLRFMSLTASQDEDQIWHCSTKAQIAVGSCNWGRALFPIGCLQTQVPSTFSNIQGNQTQNCSHFITHYPKS